MTVMDMATILWKGGSAKAGRPEEVAVRILAGLEIGLKPVQACSSIMVVNGRAVIYGDAALALVRTSGKLVSISEVIEGTGDDRVAVCVTHRKGEEPKETRFSVTDAKQAKLWKKAGPWSDYPERMLTFRARTWNLRDNYGDILSGLGIYEEAVDIPAEAVEQVAATPPAVKSATPPAAITAGPKAPSVLMATEATIAAITAARKGWLRGVGIDSADDTPAGKQRIGEAWAAKLATYGVTSAKQLAETVAVELLTDLQTAAFQQQVVEVFEEPAVAEATANDATPS